MDEEKKFTIVALDPENEIFVIHVVFFAIFDNIHPFYRASIVSLIVDKTPITVFLEYFKFGDVFSQELAAGLSEHTEINDHTINLLDSKQSPYEPIFELGSIELEIFIIYIKINSANNFITPSKSFASTQIFFFKSLMAMFAYILISRVFILTIMN